MEQISPLKSLGTPPVIPSPVLIAVGYVVVAALWVFAGDQLVLPWQAYDQGIASLLLHGKDLLLVGLTGLLLWGFAQAAQRFHRHHLDLAFDREIQLRALIESLPIPLLVIRRRDGLVLYANAWMENLTGQPSREVIGRETVSFYLEGGDHPHRLSTLTEHGPASEHEVQYRTRSGDIRTAFLNVRRMRHLGEDTLVLALVDITHRKQAEAALSKLSRAIEQSPVAVLITDRDGVVEYANPQFENQTGYSASEVVGRLPDMLASEGIPASVYREIWQAIGEGLEWVGELTSRRKDGGWYWSNTRISPIRGNDGHISHLLFSSEDISLRKAYEERLLRQANFDQLTNLPNRILVFDRLCQSLNQALHDHRSLTVMQVDLDHFKVVNDSLGHDAGDAVLRESARRLSECVPPTDTVARLGADEFLLLLSQQENDEPADMVARRILEGFAHPFQVAGTEAFVSASIGVAVAPTDGTDPNQLLRNCGAAVSRAKESGRDTYRFFTPDLNNLAARRLEIDSHLRHALDRRELHLHYQPLMDMRTGKLAGAEALLRWNNPQLGSVPPDQFIPLAEETGQIVAIGEWVLRTACHQARQWLDQGLDIFIAVNTSSRQLRHINLLDQVRDVLKETGLPPERLEMEVTETFLIQDPQRTADILEALAHLGVRLSLDDFGTGYSSLSYLKRYPFHTLKIDRSFVRDVLDDPNDKALVKAIIAMARSLNLKLIAEGVETAEQRDFLRHYDCDILQGYHYSKPLPPDLFDSFVRKQAALFNTAPEISALPA